MELILEKVIETIGKDENSHKFTNFLHDIEWKRMDGGKLLEIRIIALSSEDCSYHRKIVN